MSIFDRFVSALKSGRAPTGPLDMRPGDKVDYYNESFILTGLRVLNSEGPQVFRHDAGHAAWSRQERRRTQHDFAPHRPRIARGSRGRVSAGAEYRDGPLLGQAHASPLSLKRI